MERRCCNDEGLQWSAEAEGKFQVCGQTTPTLPAGAYSCSSDCRGVPLFTRRRMESDNLIRVPGSVSDEVVEEIERFWGLWDRFHEFGFVHRRGYLLYGKQGGGKSSLIHQIVANIVADGHVAFFCGHPYYFVECLTQFRMVEP